jgi:hypothetical protein
VNLIISTSRARRQAPTQYAWAPVKLMKFLGFADRNIRRHKVVWPPEKNPCWGRRALCPLASRKKPLQEDEHFGKRSKPALALPVAPRDYPQEMKAP